jgi:hypothetical protein
MPYTSGWERLSDAVNRVMAATNASEHEAQADICQGLSDGAVEFRARLKCHASKHMTSNKTVLDSTAFDTPHVIRRDELDWERSRPNKPWHVKRGAHALPGLWNLDWIELSRADVTSILCPAKASDSQAGEKLSKKLPVGEKQPRVKGAPTLERVQQVIRDLYPDAVPDQSTVPNKTLVGFVDEKLKSLSQPSVSKDTILRAAGRRK